MDNTLPINSSFEMIIDKLQNLLNTETVIGDPITVGEITLIPVITVSFGWWGGSGRDKDSKDSCGTSGIGLGARVFPDAMLVIKNKEVSILPIRQNHNLGKLIGMVPELLFKKTGIKIAKDCCSDDSDGGLKEE